MMLHSLTGLLLATVCAVTCCGHVAASAHTGSLSELLQEALSSQDHLTAIRRQLHQLPELSFQEHLTSAYITSQLQQLGIPYQYPVGDNILGIVASIGSGPGPVIALRADMDALPIDEPAGSQAMQEGWGSQHQGCMHACGHDAHMTMLLGAARLLKSRESQLSGRVLLVFQPAEERGGGAKILLDSGALQGVQAVAGLHVWPGMPKGTVGTKGGTIMAASDRLYLHMVGRGGHGAMPHQTADPVVAASALVLALQTLVSRETSPTDGAVVTVARFNTGPGAGNVIPDAVTLEGTIRALTNTTFVRLRRRVEEVAHAVAMTYGCHIEDLSWSPQPYPPTVNSPVMADMVLDVISKLAAAQRQLTEIGSPGQCRNVSAGGDTDGGGVGLLPQLQAARLQDPSMAAEDFSFYATVAPSVFSWLGIGDVAALHNPQFTVPDDVLPLGVALHAATAWQYLHSQRS